MVLRTIRERRMRYYVYEGFLYVKSIMCHWVQLKVTAKGLYVILKAEADRSLSHSLLLILSSNSMEGFRSLTCRSSQDTDDQGVKGARWE